MVGEPPHAPYPALESSAPQLRGLVRRPCLAAFCCSVRGSMSDLLEPAGSWRSRWTGRQTV